MTFVHQASTCQSLLRPFFTGYYTCLLEQEGGEELSNNTHTHIDIYTNAQTRTHRWIPRGWQTTTYWCHTFDWKKIAWRSWLHWMPLWQWRYNFLPAAMHFAKLTSVTFNLIKEVHFMIITELKLNKVGWKGSGVSLSIRVTLYCLSCGVRLGTDGYNDDVYVDPVFLYWFPQWTESRFSQVCVHNMFLLLFKIWIGKTCFMTKTPRLFSYSRINI